MTMLTGTAGQGRFERAWSRTTPGTSLPGTRLPQLLPRETRAILELLSVLDVRIPLAQLGRAAEAGSPSAAIEPAVTAGLVDWWPQEPTCPVEIRHQHVREAIYAGITPVRRRLLHARAVSLVSESVSWVHRVAALDRPDEGLAAELERLAAGEAADGALTAAAIHLRWASDISPARDDRERRLLTAAQHLTQAGEPSDPDLRRAVEAAAPSALRSYVLGMMALSAGQLAEAGHRLGQALAQARAESGSRPLVAVIARELAGVHALFGDGRKAAAFGRLALGGGLDAAAASQARAVIAIEVSQAAGPRGALAGLRPAAAGDQPFRGVFRLLAGDLEGAVSDLSASAGLAHRGVDFRVGLPVNCYLTLAQYLAGAWDEAALTSERGLSAAARHARRYERPLLHLAAACVPAGRGLTREAERHTRLAADAAAALDYGQERIWAAMARALACQAAGDYPGMAGALGPWQDDAALDDRSRLHAGLWRPLLAEGLIGSGQTGRAAVVLGSLRADAGPASYLQPALAWLEGWLAEENGDAGRAREVYQRGEEAAPASPVYAARLLLAHGRLLRRTGHRQDAAERLVRARALFTRLGAGPGTAHAAGELAGLAVTPLSHDPTRPAPARPALTGRETEVAQLVGKGLSNPEIAAELFVSRKAVEFHLSNVYAKYGLRGRQQLRRLVRQGGFWGGELGSFSRDCGRWRADSRSIGA
jgi:DNA-binding CsgD family transcriptional regulator